MKLMTENEYELASKQSFDYVDKKTNEPKKGYMLYLNNLSNGIQEQIFANEDLFNKYRVKDKGKLIYNGTNKGIYFQGINLVKN